MDLPPDRALTEEERFPLLTDAGRRTLQWLREHPHAPHYNHELGDRLTCEGLERVRAYADELRTGRTGWRVGEIPDWVPAFANRCLAEVPLYRKRGGSPADFAALPTVDRGDLAREPWSFVPDTQPLKELIVYDSSGTTGHPLWVLSHPETTAKYLPLMQVALASRGITLEGGSGRVSIVQVCAQKQTFVFATVATYLGEAGFAKINLHPGAWRDPNDRVAFLDDCDPEVITGDPIAFHALSKLPLRTRSKALLSSATMLLPGWQAELEVRFGCPVIDLYSATETGPIAFGVEGEHEVLPSDLYVEVLDPEGRPCPPGARGEITVTGGRNPYLPLLRYRTGDYAALEPGQGMPRLVGLEGRPPTLFRGASGEAVNNIDVTWALRRFCLSRYTLHQAEDGSLRLQVRGTGVSHEALRAALQGLFGAERSLVIVEVAEEDAWEGKVIQYTSSLVP